MHGHMNVKLPSLVSRQHLKLWTILKLHLYIEKSSQIIHSGWGKNRCANQKLPYFEIPCSQHLPPDHTMNQTYHPINLRTILIISSHNLHDYINNV